MIRLSNITSTNFRASNYVQQPQKDDKQAGKPVNDNSVTDKYLQNLALINSAGINDVKKVQKVEQASNVNPPYKNNLKSMIQNNESVMMAIVMRSFTAQDLNGDDKITLKDGEKNGTFLSAISRLDELKDDGINTIHVLPIHPPGKKNAQGTAGSI